MGRTAPRVTQPMRHGMWWQANNTDSMYGASIIIMEEHRHGGMSTSESESQHRCRREKDSRTCTDQKEETKKKKTKKNKKYNNNHTTLLHSPLFPRDICPSLSLSFLPSTQWPCFLLPLPFLSPVSNRLLVSSICLRLLFARPPACSCFFGHLGVRLFCTSHKRRSKLKSNPMDE